MRSFWLGLMEKIKHSPEWEKIRFYVGGLILFLLMPLASGWFVNATGEIFVHGQYSDELIRRWTVLFVIGVLLLFVGLKIARILYERLIPAQVEVIKGPLEQRKVVIAFLSTIGTPSERAEEKIKEHVDEEGMRGWAIKGNRGESVVVRTLQDWVNCDPMQRLTSWQQLARSIYYHWNGGSLELVILVPSKSQKSIESDGPEGSVREAPLACRVFEDLLNASKPTKRKVRVIHCPQEGVDFENLQEVMDGLERAITLAKSKEFTKEQDIKEQDMVIDITGGLKTTSIAGALKTLDRPDLIFQYIPTDGGSAGLPRAYRATTAASSYPS